MKNILKAIIICSVAGLVACTQYDLSPADTTVKGEKIPSTTTIKHIVEKYMVTDYTLQQDGRLGYYTADPIKSDSSLVINGIVTSNDLMGNQYKYIVVQEEETGGRAIRVSIDANNVSNIYPTGQRVSIVLNNWFVGKYGNTPQVGDYYVRPKDNRLSPGAMAMPIVRQTVIAYGKVDSASVVPTVMTCAEINSYRANHMELDWKLVKIKNAHFTQANGASNQPAGRIIFAPSTDGIGFPQTVEISDGTGRLNIATSEYSRFAQTTIPSASYIGDITCIVSWYQSRPDVTGSFQLTLRNLKDLGIGFEEYLKSIGQ